MKQLILAILLTVGALCAHSVSAQVAPEVTIVRINDGGAGKGVIAIAHPDGTSESLDFDHRISGKGLEAGAQGLRQVIQRLYQQGYSLKSTAGGQSGFVTTLVFVREK